MSSAEQLMLDVVGHVGDARVAPPRPLSCNPAYLLDEGLEGTPSSTAAARRRPPLKLDARGLPATWLHVQSHHVRRMKAMRDMKKTGGGSGTPAGGRANSMGESGTFFFEGPSQPDPMLILAPASSTQGLGDQHQQQQGRSSRQGLRPSADPAGSEKTRDSPGAWNGGLTPTRTGTLEAPLQQSVLPPPQNSGFPMRKVLRGRPSSAARISRKPSPFVDPFSDTESPDSRAPDPLTTIVNRGSRPHSATSRHMLQNPSPSIAFGSEAETGPEVTGVDISGVVVPTALTPAPTMVDIPIASGEPTQMLRIEGVSQSLENYPVVPNGSLAGQSGAGGESEASRSLVTAAAQRPRSAKKVTFDVASAASEQPLLAGEMKQSEENQVARVEQPATPNGENDTAFAEDIVFLHRLTAMGETAGPEAASEAAQNSDAVIVIDASGNEPNSNGAEGGGESEGRAATAESPSAASQEQDAPRALFEDERESIAVEFDSTAVESMRSTPSIATGTGSIRSTPSLRGNSRVNSQFMPYYYASGKGSGLTRRPSSGMSAPVRVGYYGHVGGDVEQGYIVDRSLRVRARIIKDRFERLYRVLDSRPPAYLDFIYKQAGVDRGVRAPLERPHSTPGPGMRSRAPLSSLLDRRASASLMTPHDSFRPRSAFVTSATPEPAYGDRYPTSTSQSFPASTSISAGPALDLLGPTPTAGPTRVASASGTSWQWNSHFYLSNFKDVVPVVSQLPDHIRLAAASAQTRSRAQSRGAFRGSAHELEFVHFCAPLDAPGGDMT